MALVAIWPAMKKNSILTLQAEKILEADSKNLSDSVRKYGVQICMTCIKSLRPKNMSFQYIKNLISQEALGPKLSNLWFRFGLRNCFKKNKVLNREIIGEII
jgi:hypothetical protein